MGEYNIQKRRGRKPKNIFEKFNTFTKEEIWDAFNRLREDQKALIIKAYGPYLDDSSLRFKIDITERRKVDSIVHNTLFRYLKNPEKKARIIKTVFDYFPNNTKEEVEEAFTLLSESTQVRIKEVYGESLTETEKRKNIDGAELKRIHELIDVTLRRKVEGKRLIRALNIYEYFSDFSKEEIIAAFNTLTPSQQELLKRAYGDNLDDATKRLTLSAKERAHANDIIRSTLRSRISPEFKREKKVKNIFERLSHYTKEEILEGFSRLKEEQQLLLIKAYGEDLTSHNLYSTLTEIEKKRVNGIISHKLSNRLIKKQTISPKIKTIYELYDKYTKEEILDAISRLKEGDRAILQKAFGEDYNDISLRHELTKTERQKLNGILHSALIRRLQNPKLKAQIVSNIFETYSTYSEEEVLAAFQKLNSNQQNLLFRAFGEDLKDSQKLAELTAKERQAVKKVINTSLKSKLIKREVRRRVKNIYERYPNYSEAEILDAVSRLTTDSKELLYRAYGADLTRKDLYANLSEAEKMQVRNIVQTSIKCRLENKKERKPKTINRYSSLATAYSKYAWADILEAIAKLTEEEQKLLQDYYGTDYTKTCDYDNIPITEKEKIDILLKHKIINDLKIKKAHLLSCKTVFEILDGQYSSEEIIKALQLLKKHDQEILIAAYGEKLDSIEAYQTYNSSQKSAARKIVVNKLKRILEGGITDYNQSPNVFERLHDYSKEVVWDAFQRLPDDKKQLLISVFGPDLLDHSKYSQLSKKERTKVCVIIRKDIQNRINNPILAPDHKGRIVKNIFERYPEKTSAEIMLGFSQINPTYQGILLKAFGPNLDLKDQFSNLSEHEKVICTKALGALRIKINPQQKTREYIIMNLFEHFPTYSKEEIITVFKSLPIKDQELLKKAYGVELDNKTIFHMLIADEKSRVYSIIHKMKIYLEEQVSEITLPKKNTELEIKYIKYLKLSYYYDLNKSEQQQILADYLEVTPRFQRLYQKASSEEKRDLLSAEIENSQIKKEEFFTKKEYLLRKIATNYSALIPFETALKIAYNSLEIAARYYDLRTNKSFDEYASFYINKEIQNYIKSREANGEFVELPRNRGFKAVSLREYIPNASLEQIKEALKLLPEKHQELFKKAYGENLDSSANFTNLRDSEKTKVYRLRKILKEYLNGEITDMQLQKGKTRGQKYKETPTPFEYFPTCDQTELLEIIGLLSPTDQELLKKAYGEEYLAKDRYNDLSKSEKNRIYKIRMIIKNHLNGTQTIKKNNARYLKRGKQSKSLRQYLSNYTLTEITEEVKKLTYEEQQLLIKAYGEQYDSIEGYSSMPTELKKRIIQIKNKLLRHLQGFSADTTIKNKKLVCLSLKEQFSNYSLEELLYVISLLKENEQELLQKAYGEDYSSIEGYLSLSINERQKLYKIRKKISNYFNGIITEDKLLKIKRNETARSLKDHFKAYNEDMLLAYISVLSEYEQELLVKAYGTSFDNTIGYSLLLDSEKAKVNSTRQKIKRFFIQELTIEEILNQSNSSSTAKPPQSLKELFKDYPEAELQKHIASLTKEEKELLIKAYGTNLEEHDGYYSLTDFERKRIISIRKKIKRHLDNKSSKGVTRVPLQQYLGGIPLEQLKELVQVLPEKSQIILIRAYGEEFNSFYGYKGFTRYETKMIYDLREKLLKVVNREADIASLKSGSQGRQVKSLLEHLDGIDLVEIKKAISKLSTPDQELLIKAYGKDYNSKYLFSSLTSEEKVKIEYVRQKLIKELTKDKEGYINYTPKERKARSANSIMEYFSSYPKEKVLANINNLSKYDKELLIKAYGQNYDETTGYYTLSKKEKARIASIRYKIKKHLEKGDVITPKAPTSERLFDEDIKPRRTSTKESTSGISIYNLKYKPLTREAELLFIKKAKLSYFHDVDEDTQKKYLNYYFEVFQFRKKRYYQILEEITELEKEINSEMANKTNVNIEYLKELSLKIKKLNSKRERLLESYIEDSKRYRDKFLENNQRLVMSIAKKWGNQSFNELLMEGNIGMMRALEKYDVESGNKFSTYATWWIKQAISRYVADYGSTIRIPVHLGEKIKRLNRIYEELSQQLHREPTEEELAQVTGYEIELIRELKKYQTNIQKTTSLDQVIGEDSDTTFDHFVGEEDVSFDETENSIFFAQFNAFIGQANLSQRELDILFNRLGLDNTYPKSLEELAQEYGLSRERIRQIETTALSKLRLAARKGSFFDYMKDNPKVLSKRLF